MIFDSNVLIYISKKVINITDIIQADDQPAISVISYIEALGYAFKADVDRYYMEQICASCQIISLNERIIQQTINLRGKYKIKLPDAIIYATAAVENTSLVTNNIADFARLDGKVELINPFSL